MGTTINPGVKKMVDHCSPGRFPGCLWSAAFMVHVLLYKYEFSGNNTENNKLMEAIIIPD